MTGTTEAEKRATFHRIMHDEEVGVRHRMEHYYLPLIAGHCRTLGIEPAEAPVLDCGCGNGLSVELLAQAGFPAFGVDLWPVRHEQWKERAGLPRVGLCMADGRQLPFPDARFEVVLSCGVLEHVGVAEEWEPEYRVAPLPDQAEQRRWFLAECLRVLRPTGVLYLDHPNGAFPIDFWHTKDAQGRQPRFHSLREGFLPSFGEVRHLAREIDPRCRVRALSPAGRFTFRRVKRRWYGQVFGGPSEAFFNLLRYWPLKWLAATPLNPYLVIEISRQTY